MTDIYTTKNSSIEKIEKPESGCWISVIAPDAAELASVSEMCSVDIDALKAALDEDERSRIPPA